MINEFYYGKVSYKKFVKICKRIAKNEERERIKRRKEK